MSLPILKNIWWYLKNCSNSLTCIIYFMSIKFSGYFTRKKIFYASLVCSRNSICLQLCSVQFFSFPVMAIKPSTLDTWSHCHVNELHPQPCPISSYRICGFSLTPQSRITLPVALFWFYSSICIIFLLPHESNCIAIFKTLLVYDLYPLSAPLFIFYLFF